MKKLIVLMLPVTVAILTIFQSPAQAQHRDPYEHQYEHRYEHQHEAFYNELTQSIDEVHDYTEREEMKEEIYRLKWAEDQRRRENPWYPEPDRRQ
jgi:hypothetical protein